GGDRVIRVAVTIAAPPRALWDELERIEDHVHWMVDARAIEFTGPQRRGVGTEFDCVTRIGPFTTTDRMTVTEWSPGHALGIEHRGIVHGRGRFVLHRRRRGRTKFVWEERLRFPWWMGGRPGVIVASPVLRAVFRRDLRRLQQRVEA